MTEDFDKHFILANSLYKNGELEQAIHALEIILSKNKEHGRANALLGHIKYQLGADLIGAEFNFKIALKISGEFADAYYDYASLLLKMNRYPETIAVVNRGMEVFGIEKDRLYAILGLLHETQLQWDLAIENYTSAIINCYNSERINDYQKDLQRVALKKGL